MDRFCKPCHKKKKWLLDTWYGPAGYLSLRRNYIRSACEIDKTWMSRWPCCQASTGCISPKKHMLNDTSRYLTDIISSKSPWISRFWGANWKKMIQICHQDPPQGVWWSQTISQKLHLRLEERAKESRLQDLLDGAETKVSGLQSFNLNFQLIDLFETWEVSGQLVSSMYIFC